ncbi:hypothetical protein TNCV_3310941 [Trichonephila clavipes]|nr:hypothetical protein TNCV_3310941 [Trichonephila clavipes]
MNGDCRDVLRPGRPTKLRDRNQRVMSEEILRNHLKSMAYILMTTTLLKYRGPPWICFDDNRVSRLDQT